MKTDFSMLLDVVLALFLVVVLDALWLYNGPHIRQKLLMGRVYNVYLGIVMVFSAVDPPDVYGKGKVHCELAWSRDGKQYTRVNPGFDFIPHGSIAGKAFDSHICFASAHPLKMEGYSTSSVAKTKEKSGKTKTMETTNDSEMFNMSSTTALHHRVYYFGGDGPHCTSRDVCLSAFSLSFTPSFAHSPLTTATTSPSPSHKQIYP